MSGIDIKIQQQAGRTQVTISGVVDESVDLASLKGLTGHLEFNLKDVRRFNSAGVRVWIDVLRELDEKCQLSFVECPATVIDQLNMINGFLASGAVRSFYGVMICEHCDTEVDHLFDTKECRELDRLEPVNCDKCKRKMDLDADEDQYLLFMREPTRIH